MTEDNAGKLRALLEEYRGPMKAGGHPKELPDRVLALVRDCPAESQMPHDLEPLYAAASHYWRYMADFPEGGPEPDPLDLEMVYDELIDALYEFYGVR